MFISRQLSIGVLEQKLSPLIDQKTYSFDEELARNGILPVHKVANENEQNDEDVQQEWRLDKEVVSHDEEGLDAVSASDGSNQPHCARVGGHGGTVSSMNLLIGLNLRG